MNDRDPIADAAMEKVSAAIRHLTGPQVAEIAAGVMAMAIFRTKESHGYSEAANIASSLSGAASGMGLDMRRLAMKVKANGEPN